ncbi:CRISPR-associated protein Cas7 [Caprobacter fermentans]|uniref:CRISPR-associated protein Cas7 n=1 Tax=Caproicibacter fermentans TaxID=2576756 RepID=A0A6N8I2E3_9FIRM|nr:type I-C CRISPR-associated protein Cas7/Csd2 [Caproicibacter fermentans]MVB11703.1 CRISPR-associated protein Cas7 [Caproicibacter fermentans]OCN01061.1 type I-C CRISPR-associated protein Cas7/Csd2 [Clostridium sp. W14A]
MSLHNRYEFVMLFDVENGNPNGDPDAGNMPRVDAETSIGIVTDVCLKRKIRNYVEATQEGKPGYNILIKNDRALNTKYTEAYDACNLKTKQKGKDQNAVAQARDYICRNYFDVRTFGAVMSTGDDPCGIVRGPVQINFARSIDPVLPQEITITRQALTTESDQSEKGNTMGKKNFIPYGLYRAEGYVSALLANKTGFSEDDLALLWRSIENMFEIDHSAARGKLCMRKLYVFKHDSALGNAPSHLLFDKIAIEKKSGVEIPRKFSNYNITIDKSMPEGVEIIEKF